MTEDFLPFGSPRYWIYLGLLVFARGMDFLSTWIATPNLVLEANPLAKKLGWKGGISLNLTLCAAFALWPMPAVIIATTSVLVAARNFQSAWLMRSLGEERYRGWIAEQLRQTSRWLYVMCLLAQTALVAGVGGALMFFCERQMIPFAVGMGIITYALAVTLYTLLSVWRLRR
ncbi:MAG: hypothetical protein ACYDH9_03425 [Limisphaerales bacterium]